MVHAAKSFQYWGHCAQAPNQGMPLDPAGDITAMTACYFPRAHGVWIKPSPALFDTPTCSISGFYAADEL